MRGKGLGRSRVTETSRPQYGNAPDTGTYPSPLARGTDTTTRTPTVLYRRCPGRQDASKNLPAPLPESFARLSPPARQAPLGTVTTTTTITTTTGEMNVRMMPMKERRMNGRGSEEKALKCRPDQLPGGNTRVEEVR